MARSNKAPWPPVQPREVKSLAERMAELMGARQAEDTWEATVDETALTALLAGTETVSLERAQQVRQRVIDVQEGRRMEWPCHNGKRISRATLGAFRARLELAIEAKEA